MKRLLLLGSDVNCTNSEGKSAFSLALCSSSTKFDFNIVRDIIFHGYNCNENFVPSANCHIFR